MDENKNMGKPHQRKNDYSMRSMTIRFVLKMGETPEQVFV